MSDRADDGKAIMGSLLAAMREVAASNRALVAQQAQLGAQMTMLSDRLDALALAVESGNEEVFSQAGPASLGVGLGRAVLQGMLGGVRPYQMPPPPPPAFGRRAR